MRPNSSFVDINPAIEYPVLEYTNWLPGTESGAWLKTSRTYSSL